MGGRVAGEIDIRDVPSTTGNSCGFLPLNVSPSIGTIMGADSRDESVLSETLPVVDVDLFLSESQQSPKALEECKKARLLESS